MAKKLKVTFGGQQSTQGDLPLKCFTLRNPTLKLDFLMKAHPELALVAKRNKNSFGDHAP